MDPKSYIFTMFMCTFERFFIFVILFVKQVEIFTRKFFYLIATWIHLIFEYTLFYCMNLKKICRYLAGILKRKRERETDRQSDGDDSSYCVFIVSNMFDKVIFNIRFTFDYVFKPTLNCYTVISVIPFTPRIENLSDFLPNKTQTCRHRNMPS